MNRGNGNTVATLNLMEDKFVARLSSRLKLSGGGSSDQSKEPSSNGGKCGRGRGRGHGSNSGGRGGGRGGGDTGEHGGKNTGHDSDGGSGDAACDECCYCGKNGHWAREFRKKKCDEEVHTAQVDNEEETTLLANATITELVATPERTAIHLDELKLFVQLRDREHGDCSRWIVDSGATNHMTGERGTFMEIDNKVHDTVRFGDGAVASIKGEAPS
jgi:hypothetical protein